MQPLTCPDRPPDIRPRRAAIRPAARAGLCVATVAAALAGTVPAAAGPATATPAVDPATAGLHTVRSAAGYHIVVDGVARAAVRVSDPGNSVRATLSPSGRHAAVVGDFNGRHGTELLSLDLGSGQLTRIAAGRVTSAVYTQDGRLGYVLADDRSGQLRLRQPDDGSTRVVANLDGSDVQLIGWGEGSAAALLTHRAVGEPSGPSLTRVDVATGTARTVLTSDAAKGVVYRDIRTVRIDGAQRVSAIVADHSYPCAGTSSSLLLADEHGTPVIRTGGTRDSYREAAWSPDGDRVAYTIQACISTTEKAAGRSQALRRLDALNGTYVRDLAATTARRVVEGITPHYRLDGFAGPWPRLTSDRYGIQAVDPARPVAAAQLDATAATTAPAATVSTKAAFPTGRSGVADGTGVIGTQSKIVGSTFIHQLWDTADNFNGNSACGPTSAVMDLAGYQLANPNGYYVSTPSRHWSPYGRYITHSYTAYGTTYDAVAPDPNWNYFAGAYGWLVETPSQGTIHRWMGDYLDRHVSYPVAETGNVTWSWIKSKIDANLMVVVSGNFAYGQYGHIGLITGYLDDGRVYVNDPYGAGTDGSWDGKNTVYTLDYIRGWYAWAA
ncbi:C39 family peptidase [Micromonospora halophytica]|uniref:Peptidase_C39 like family protein n=1 Tax=Micromonospora halophytica TaxID=47864 RepID=A0A1C5HSF4_9ACTN|nr:C39 family peptidase [Micromonospora halophytica]SCG48945.1 Peptidase_C39 like family protein [Micromonospora halophytica]